MQPFCNLSETELQAFFKELELPSFRALQVIDWVYKKGVTDFDLMTNLDLKLRVLLKERFGLPLLKLVRSLPSADNETEKFLFALQDGQFVEAVLISAPSRLTLCVSSQVGCAARCAFCASGKKGLKRDLETAEIIEQLLHVNAHLAQDDKRISHVVFMGMGEPMDNYDAVVRAIYLLTHPSFFGLSQRRITVSTVGVIPGILKFAEEDLKVNLVLSLHAPNQKLREKIIPYARRYPLPEILQAMEGYAEKTKRDITYEYTLMAGLNDGKEHAEELATLLYGKQCTVNLIPYNPVMGLKLKRPERSDIESFREILDRKKIVNTCRYTKGDDIAAACGQLALQESIGETGVSP